MQKFSLLLARKKRNRLVGAELHSVVHQKFSKERVGNNWRHGPPVFALPSLRRRPPLGCAFQRQDPKIWTPLMSGILAVPSYRLKKRKNCCFGVYRIKVMILKYLSVNMRSTFVCFADRPTCDLFCNVLVLEKTNTFQQRN